jgi:2'-5' RNA ligase
VASLDEMTVDERRARSALLIVVPEVEPLIGDVRRRYTAEGAHVPAHLTLLNPFFAPAETTPAVRRRVAEVVGAFPSFGLSLTRLASFPQGVLYLTPEPATPVIELITRLRNAFPEVAPYWDGYEEVVPHVTIADAAFADPPSLRRDVVARLTGRLPISCLVREAVLLQRVRPAPAPWDEQSRFAFAG